MPGYVIEKHGFISGAAMMASVIDDMIANGFTKIFPSSPFNSSNPGEVFSVTLEASGTVDPLNGEIVSKQPWRICIDVKAKDLVGVYLGTPLQLPDDGTHAKERNASGATVDILGSVGGVATNGVVAATALDSGFINRGTRVGTDGASYPMSYRLVITNRGFFLGVWEAGVSTSSGLYFNWILVQRPVDRTTGSIITTGKAPVFCLNRTNEKYYQFVVRESDILRPSGRRVADSNAEDSEGTINTKNQVSLAEDGKYIVTFPSRLNTSRYRYPHELDIVGTTSADVVGQFTDVPLTVYGEGSPRIYTAMQANGSGNTGMRLLVLKSGGGIS